MLFVWVAALNRAGNLCCAGATAASVSITSNDGIVVNRIDISWQGIPAAV
jgi:hypothetical protein